MSFSEAIIQMREEIKNKIVEEKLYFQVFQKDYVENIMDDFKKEDYSNDFLLDLEAALKNTSSTI
jgi:hypothetical protein